MIRTVLGDIDPEQLGVTFAHEHLLMTGGWPVMQEPDFRLDSVAAAVEEVGGAAAAGLQAVVEMTPLGFGRSATGLAEVSRSTGVHIIAATGLHKVNYYADNHWMHRYSAEQIADLLTAEVQVGMDEFNLEGPLIERTDAKAGVVKVATSYQRPGRSVDKLIEAVASVQLRTGVPIATHCDKGTWADHLLDRLESAGVAPDRVILGHIDHNPDAGLLADLAARGAYLCFDRPGRVKYAPDSASIELLHDVAERGAADRILLGSDLARRSYWTSLGGGPGLAYLLTTFLPRSSGTPVEAVVRRALTANAAHALALRTSGDGI